ncbi:hypothetical protein [Piscinibacter terrae]|uniref:Lipoprotein n=1 Tax=Piscinibacter terrae TaxID=2496871 RepID=A0A3N7HLE5_9BURK|nr:hypothetical protein [Albitalea terrae]RQP22383.1 hypothetical protein DZC73_22265 [Albitalea terrae]
MQQSHISSGKAFLGLAGAMAAAALLASCVATAPPRPLVKYVPPTGGPTARLVMRGTVPAGELFSVNVFEDAEKCEGTKLVGVGSSTVTPKSSSVVANAVTTVEYRVDKPALRQVCVMRWTFTPVAGRSYLVRGQSTPTGCGAAVFDMTDPENIKFEPTALRRNPKGSACVPIGQSKALGVAGAASSATSGDSGDAVLRQGAGSEELQGLIGK